MDAKVSRLIALGPPGSVGKELELTHGYMTLGRSHSNDLVLSEPTVSRVHASVTVEQDGRVSVHDLGSSAGTTVNGRPATGPVILRSGDVVSAGGARFQYPSTHDNKVATAPLPVQGPPRPRPRDEHTQGQHEIENQHAGNISNVAGNQYAYVSHMRQERGPLVDLVWRGCDHRRSLLCGGRFSPVHGRSSQLQRRWSSCFFSLVHHWVVHRSRRFDSYHHRRRPPYIAAVADFDGDGRAEILVTSPWGIGILEQAGNTLGNPVIAPNGTRFGGWLLSTADNEFGV